MSKDVQKMFQGIARRYDCTNDVLSFGLHRWWRNIAVAKAGLQPGQKVLDICAGTGDLAFAAAAKVGSSGRVYALDFVQEMVRLGDTKKTARQKGSIVSFLQGDALHLPLPNSSVDAVTIGFGIRNVDDPLAGLREMRRVLKPNGIFCVLEFGQPQFPVFSWAYRTYSKYIIPLIGGLLSGNRDAYTYLPESSEAFIAGNRFVDLAQQAGFQSVSYTPLLSGVAYIYTGFSPASS